MKTNKNKFISQLIGGIILAAFLFAIYLALTSYERNKIEPATAEQVRNVLFSQGYQPIDSTQAYYNQDTNLIECVSVNQDDLLIDFFVFNNENSAINVYGAAHSKIIHTRREPCTESRYNVANYSMYFLKTTDKYSAAIQVENTAIYAYCDTENKDKLVQFLVGIGYLE